MKKGEVVLVVVKTVSIKIALDTSYMNSCKKFFSSVYSSCRLHLHNTLTYLKLILKHSNMKYLRITYR